MNKSYNWQEAELIDALSRGGAPREKATEYLMRKYIGFIPDVVKKTGLDRNQGLDAFTDAIIDLTEQVTRGKFRGQSKLSSYLYQIFYYKAVDLSRKNKTNRIELSGDLPDITDPLPIASRKMETSESVAQLYKLLDQLGQPCKQILIDWGFWGYNMTEIAERTGLEGSKQAKDRKYRCLLKLRKLREQFA